jgi:hypothetical protein
MIACWAGQREEGKSAEISPRTGIEDGHPQPSLGLLNYDKAAVSILQLVGRDSWYGLRW